MEIQEMTSKQHQQIIDQLEGLNEKLARQNHWGHIFATAIVYGVGFVIGSTILASILASIFLPVLERAPYMHAILPHPITAVQTAPASQ
jgi:hypothetical protein